MAEIKYNKIIVDCYNVIFKAHWIEKESLVKCGSEIVHTEGIIGFFKAVESYISRFGTEDVKIYWLMDNAKTSVIRYRKALSDTYKKNRKQEPEWFYREIDFIELILKYYRNNSELYRLKSLEADDYVMNILSAFVKPEDKVLMISEDSDWCRALAGNVHQYKDQGIYTKEIFLEKKGYMPTYSNICFDKTFYGDKTDNILPALPNLPKVYFMDIISKFSTASEFIYAVKSNKLDYLDKGWQMKVLKEEENILMNWNLVESVKIEDETLRKFAYNCSYKQEKLKIIYASLGLIGKFDERIKPKDTGNDIFDMLSGENLARQ